MIMFFLMFMSVAFGWDKPIPVNNGYMVYFRSTTNNATSLRGFCIKHRHVTQYNMVLSTGASHSDLKKLSIMPDGKKMKSYSFSPTDLDISIKGSWKWTIFPTSVSSDISKGFFNSRESLVLYWWSDDTSDFRTADWATSRESARNLKEFFKLCEL